MNSNKKPKLSSKQVYKEISKRTNVPSDVVAKVIQSYGEIVEQCLKNKIQISLSRIGTFTYKEVPPLDYTEWIGAMSGKEEPVLYWQEKVSGFSKPRFSFTTSCRQRINDATRVPYGTVPSLPGYRRSEDDPHERINYKEYLKKNNYERYLLLFENDNSVNAEDDYFSDDYNFLIMDDNDGEQ